MMDVSLVVTLLPPLWLHQLAGCGLLVSLFMAQTFLVFTNLLQVSSVVVLKDFDLFKILG
jgi:hypothetical protein